MHAYIGERTYLKFEVWGPSKDVDFINQLSHDPFESGIEFAVGDETQKSTERTKIFFIDF